MAYQIGKTELALVDVKALLGLDPQSQYAPGVELVNVHDGGQQVVGCPRSKWTLAALPVATYETLVQTTLGFTTTQYSGEVYVQTRNEYDDWLIYRAILRLPNPVALHRWGAYYTDIEWEFVLIEDVTPP